MVVGNVHSYLDEWHECCRLDGLCCLIDDNKREVLVLQRGVASADASAADDARLLDYIGDKLGLCI